jgi:hypothetical protein
MNFIGSVRFVILAILACTAVTHAGETGLTTPHDVQIPAAEDVGQDVLIEGSELLRSPPANPEVGDSWIWWLWTWQPMPPHFEEHVCTVRGKSDRGYVVVKDVDWLVTIDQADVDSILEHWDNSSIGPYPGQGIYQIDSLAFGTPPDELDNDPRIYLMWYNFHISADGFFFYFDEYPEGTFPGYHSNECEVLYLNTASTGGPSGDYMHAVIAHEFEHLIHWKYDENENSWVDEGMAELAMWFYGNPDDISSFNSNPDNNLTLWDGNWADYIQTYLWSLYFFERYGGHPAVYALVHESLNSMAGFDAVLDDFGFSENTEDVFIDWAVANFLDDTTLGDGRYGYQGDDLPPFSVAGTYSTYPVVANKTVNSWAADYYRFDSFPFDTLELTFDGADNNTFGIRAIVIHSAAPSEVRAMTLDEPTQSGTLEIGCIPSDEVIMVVASLSSAGGPDYQFAAGDALGISTDPDMGTANFSLDVFPNPFGNSANIRMAWDSEITGEIPSIEIFDIRGCLVNRITAETSPDGEALLVWNGDVCYGGRANAGLYYVRGSMGGAQCVRKVVLLP